MEAKRICGEDRILELLCQNEMTPKDAARTCVLSKRWYNFWTSRPKLVLSQEGCKTYTYKSPGDFVKLVDQSLKPHV